MTVLSFIIVNIQNGKYAMRPKQHPPKQKQPSYRQQPLIQKFRNFTQSITQIAFALTSEHEETWARWSWYKEYNHRDRIENIEYEAIVFADIAGFSQQKSRDEKKSFDWYSSVIHIWTFFEYSSIKWIEESFWISFAEILKVIGLVNIADPDLCWGWLIDI